jgi:peptidyl-prolyl cis-trans isomerase A (cyclophilin A)
MVCCLVVSCGRTAETKCTIHTETGSIEVTLYPGDAPVTVANFLRYVDAGLYDSTTIFRVCNRENEASRAVRIEVIQGGDVEEVKCFPPIEIETTRQTGLRHLDGTLSMARAGPNSATASYFICIGDQPELDHGGKRNPDGYGFAAFGRVTEGMDIVRRIQQMPDSNQMLIDPVIVWSVDRLDRE